MPKIKIMFIALISAIVFSFSITETISANKITNDGHYDDWAGAQVTSNLGWDTSLVTDGQFAYVHVKTTSQYWIPGDNYVMSVGGTDFHIHFTQYQAEMAKTTPFNVEAQRGDWYIDEGKVGEGKIYSNYYWSPELNNNVINIELEFRVSLTKMVPDYQSGMAVTLMNGSLAWNQQITAEASELISPVDEVTDESGTDESTGETNESSAESVSESGTSSEVSSSESSVTTSSSSASGSTPEVPVSTTDETKTDEASSSSVESTTESQPTEPESESSAVSAESSSAESISSRTSLPSDSSSEATASSTTSETSERTPAATTATTGATSTSSVASSSSESVAESTTTKKPNVRSAFKPFKLVTSRALYLYKGVNFNTANRIGKLKKNSTVTVIGTAKTKNGTGRYQVRLAKDKVAYVTSNKKFVSPLYLTKQVKALRVKNAKGIYEYKSQKMTKQQRVQLLKKGASMRVKRIVTVGSVTRFQLTNGHYVTANRLFVTATK